MVVYTYHCIAYGIRARALRSAPEPIAWGLQGVGGLKSLWHRGCSPIPLNQNDIDCSAERKALALMP